MTSRTMHIHFSLPRGSIFLTFFEEKEAFFFILNYVFA
jgi:hypothetical protein